MVRTLSLFAVLTALPAPPQPVAPPQIPPTVLKKELAPGVWPAPPAGGLTAFRPGEKLTYRLHYGFIDAAYGELTVRDAGPVNGRSTWEMVARGWTHRSFNWFFKVEDTYRSRIDVATLHPVQFVRDVSEGGYEIHQDYRFDWPRRFVETEEHRRRPPTGEGFRVPEGTHDMVSAFAAARNWDLSKVRKGDVLTIHTLIDGELFPLRMRFGGAQDRRGGRGDVGLPRVPSSDPNGADLVRRRRFNGVCEQRPQPDSRAGRERHPRGERADGADRRARAAKSCCTSVNPRAGFPNLPGHASGIFR